MGGAPNLELVVGRPAGAAVVRDYLAGREQALRFFGAHFEDAEAYRAKAAEIDGRFDGAARRRAAAALRVPPGGDPARLERFVEEGGYVVTTGQQPALLGGPLYSVYKGLTAVRLAETLERLLGKVVLPVFWVASEDHDWEEADHTYIVGTDNEIHHARVEPASADVRPAIHRVPLGEDAAPTVSAFLELLPNTDFSIPYLEYLRDTVVPGRTLSESYTDILQRLLAPFGMLFVDAASPALKQASRPTLMSELARAEELESVLADTGSALREAGYDLQVALMPGGVNLFLDGPAGRERLYRADGGFQLRTSGAKRSADQILAESEADPSVLSPNVLLRPVVESAVLPTLSYVGGPGEMAYLAQLRGYFEAFGMRMPVIHPRFSVTVVESKIRKVLDKFDLDVQDLARPFHEVAGEIARDEMPQGLKGALGALRGSVAKGVGQVQKEAGQVDPTLKGPTQHIRSQAFAAIDEMEKKAVQAVKRQSEITLSQLEKAQLHLFPEGLPQERVMNPAYYLARYGGAFLEEVYGRFVLKLD